jgi:NADH dehydrogenase (ubiquinone) 1 alpha subcomplex subunit 9
MGDLGQIVPTKWSIKDKDSIRRAVQHSNVIINCSGRRWDTRNFKMSDVYVEGAKMIAEVAKEEGIKHLIHVSAIPSEGTPPSDWFKTKADGEAAVRSIFPDAIVIRPATMWGAQDEFIRHHAQLMKYWPVYPLVHPNRRLQPVYIDNVAQAMVRALLSKDSHGKIYEIAGPDVITTKQFAEWVRLVLKMPNKQMWEVNEGLLWHMGYWLGQHRHPRYTLDSVKENSSVVASNKFPGLTELGIKPMKVNSEFTVSFLHPFRHPNRQMDITNLLEEIPDLETVGPGGQPLV